MAAPEASGNPVRVYLPLTPDDVRSLHSGEGVGGSGHAAYGVTALLRAAQPRADEEELEYAALLAAAAHAGRLRGEAGWRRVVAAVDVAPELVAAAAAGQVDPAATQGHSDDDGELARIALTAPVTAREVRSLHADEELAGTDDRDLQWWDVTELDRLVEHLDT
ncbi:MAG TPA: hypothetical protein P5181_03010 [Dermatophilaceae bacterium]|nr:hypothetical protein [Dermatophilaceae bacterium]